MEYRTIVQHRRRASLLRWFLRRVLSLCQDPSQRQRHTKESNRSQAAPVRFVKLTYLIYFQAISHCLGLLGPAFGCTFRRKTRVSLESGSGGINSALSADRLSGLLVAGLFPAAAPAVSPAVSAGGARACSANSGEYRAKT